MHRVAAGFAALFLGISGLCAKQIVFAAYNVENYLPMSRQIDGRRVSDAPKPEKEIAAVIRVLKQVHPDILGLEEMGDESTLRDLQKRLKAAGLDYPYREWMQGSDKVRHVCLLSRFPIVQRNSRSEILIVMNNRVERMNRGILDVTIAINSAYRLRVVGAHLKSRRPVPEYDQAVMRAKEAWFLRDHVTKILVTSPKTNLLLFGDFNDTKNEYPIRLLTGRRGSPNYMLALELQDSRDECWTYFWDAAGIYSRVDYIMVSSALTPEIVQKKSGINDASFWDEASDHRAIYTTISAKEKS